VAIAIRRFLRSFLETLIELPIPPLTDYCLLLTAYCSPLTLCLLATHLPCTVRIFLAISRLFSPGQDGRGAVMYWTSPVVGKAVALELVPTRPLTRLARRVRGRAGSQPIHDIFWAEELVSARLLTHYQAQALLAAVQCSASPEDLPLQCSNAPLKIGNYIVYERIKRSDLGTTYRAKRPAVRQSSAIKCIESRWVSDDLTRPRLLAELERWTKLGEPRIAKMTPMDSEQGGLALTSNWLPTGSLADVLRAGRSMAPANALRLVRELVTLLARADAHGLVFGDLRPSNVLLDRRGRPHLLDCGLRCAITGAGLLIERNLPPERYDYVAPEVADGTFAPDAAGDIYSIGCLLYHMITGRAPYFGGNAERKCAAHRAGRIVDPRVLGIDAGPEIQHILEATLQADRSRRVGSYNELLNRLSPELLKSPRKTRAHPRRLRTVQSANRRDYRWHSTSSGHRHWGKWLVATATAAVTAVAALHGSARLLPLFRLNPLKESGVLTSRDENRQKNTSSEQRGTVTALWNASDDLRTALREAAPRDTITLQSPGPFLLDAIEINKPITLRGAESVRPLFIGGPGTSLRITASDVHLENVHFVRVAEPLNGQVIGTAGSLVEVFGQRVVVAKCSFQDVSGESTAAINWQPAESGSEQPPTLSIRHTMFRNVQAAIVSGGRGAAQIELQNCMHLGYGPLLRSSSGPARPFEALDVTLLRSTVFGAAACEHSFPHPLDDAAPLRITSKDSLLIPHDRDQPLLAVEYAVQPSTLMPKVVWSGSSSVCPADATVLEVRRTSDSSVWRASDVAAWQKYWGTHVTGLVGARLDFAGSPPGVPSDIPAPRLTNQTTIGADTGQLCHPLPVTIEQLPVLLQRLNQ
jgi:serine/threonine protein kinase